MGFPVTYGSFNLNDGINFFVIQKPISTVSVAPTYFKIGRLDGMKKTGEATNERQIKMTVRVIGTSRIDLENQIDIMQQALNLRQQQLTVRMNDTRYYLADCIAMDGSLGPGQILTTLVTLTFICYQPYALALQTTTYDTGNVLLPFSNPDNAYKTTLSVTGGGTVYNYPKIRVIQQTSPMTTTLTAQLTSGSAYSQLSVAPIASALNTGDKVIIGTSTTKTVSVSTFTPASSTVIPVNTFTSNATYTVGTSVVRDLTLNTIQFTQTVDNSILVVGTPLPTVNGDYVDIYCDPTDVTNGFTAQKNGGPGVSTVAGVFPVLEPIATGFTVFVTANSTPTLEFIFTYTSRWLS